MEMNIVFFTHPPFLGSESMPRFAKMLGDGMARRGHTIAFWTTSPFLYNLPFFKKWMGYLDQYVLFPASKRKHLKDCAKDTLFVFTDHALGPWIPLVASRPHVIHCHDFLAQQSALGMMPENPTGWTGRIYQKFIRRGYSHGKNFISVSEKTNADLAEFMSEKGVRTKVIYNGLNPVFGPQEPISVREDLSAAIGLDLTSGYLLHVGGNQWYKNREGVIRIYNAWRKLSRLHLPLLLVGPKPNPQLKAFYAASPYRSDMYLLTGMNDGFVRKAYSGASLFIFPSLAEGFGWPIAEAMASGCPVITTNEAPMTEVAGDAAILVPRQPMDATLCDDWALQTALKIEEVLHLNVERRKEMIVRGVENSKRFDAEKALDQIEAIYKEVLFESRLS